MTHNKPCTTMDQHLARVHREESTLGTRAQPRMYQLTHKE